MRLARCFGKQSAMKRESHEFIRGSVNGNRSQVLGSSGVKETLSKQNPVFTTHWGIDFVDGYGGTVHSRLRWSIAKSACFATIFTRDGRAAFFARLMILRSVVQIHFPATSFIIGSNGPSELARAERLKPNWVRFPDMMNQLYSCI